MEMDTSLYHVGRVLVDLVTRGNGFTEMVAPAPIAVNRVRVVCIDA